MSPPSRPRVVVLRGQFVNPWELRTWELLADRFEMVLPVADTQRLRGISSDAVDIRPVRTLAGLLPSSPVQALAQRLPQNRYRGGRHLLAEADLVHGAELSFWFTAQAAALKERLGFRLVTTVWETIPFGRTLRHPLARRNRERVLASADLFLPTTERARDALLLEGADPTRVVVSGPGVDLQAFGAARRVTPDEDPLVLSPGRLVWEKGHQDVLRAVAALRRGLVTAPDPARAARTRVLIVGAGAEESSLRRHAADLGIADAVELHPKVPYDEMPAIYGRAWTMALMSLPLRGWEEQFGMVLAEGMAAGLPVIASSSGAIPEVVHGAAKLVAPGDWMGLARALATGPLLEGPVRVDVDAAVLERHSHRAAAARLAAAYDRVLGR